MPKKMDYIDEIIKHGARVVKPVTPSLVITPPVLVEEVVTLSGPDPVSVEDCTTGLPAPETDAMANELENHFKNSEPYHAGEYKPETVSSQHACKEIGNRVDGVVVSYRPKWCSGFVRICKYGRFKSGLFFGADDIVSGDLIGVGPRVRCLVGPPNGKEGLTAREIEILPDSESDSAGPETTIYKLEIE
jgi:hypothetical protein